MRSRAKRIIGISLIFVIAASVMVFGQDMEVLHHFSGSDGSRARGPLLEHDGYLYGVSFRGGASNTGALYKIRKDGSGFELLHSFNGASGQYPNYGGVITDGTWLYGMTSMGGSYDAGTLYRIGFDGANHQVLHNFGSGSDGSDPYGKPFISGNTLYGLTRWGGANSQGAFFRMDMDGSSYQVLHNFVGGTTGGSEPYHNLTWDGSRFYSSTAYGGTSGQGVVFAINPDGSGFTILHSFAGGTGDGSSPGYSSPIHISGYLYGLTREGGASNLGVAYKIKTDGSDYNIIRHFGGSPGSVRIGWQTGSLLENNGWLYGISNGGGANDRGAVFRMDKSGNGFALLHSFSAAADGESPRSTPIISNGFLYGNCYNGGSSDDGTLFRISLNGIVSANILPQKAVAAGAQWRLSFQAGWRDSGKSAKGLPAGNYTIVFKPLEGWKKPADQFITVENNGFVSVTGEYTQKGTDLEYGHLKVVLKPIFARKHGAQWSVVGSGEWQDSGDRVKLPVGVARIKFGRVKGYSRPDVAVVQILKNTSTVVKKVYLEK